MIITRILAIILACLSSKSDATEVAFAEDRADEYIANVTKASFTQATDDIGGRTTGLADVYEDYPRTSIGPAIRVFPPSYPPVTYPTSAMSTYRKAGPKLIQADDPSGSDHEDVLSWRDKRSLTFPDPSTILVIFGLGTPLQLDRESIIVGAFTKFIYNLPSNSTDFTEPGVHFARRKSRWSIYKALERAAELYGWGGGKGCLLRSICEVAAAPFDLRHGLFGRMAQAFLTPSSTSEAYDDYGDREYHAAERLGRNADENCHALYPECQRSFLDVFSAVVAIGTPNALTTDRPEIG